MLTCLWQPAAMAEAAGAASITAMTATREDMPRATFRFPRVSGVPGAPAINAWMQANVLERTPYTHDHTPFDAVWPAQGDFHGTTSIDYQIRANRPGYLSIGVHTHYLGAYPSHHVTVFNFDASHGKPITLRDLIDTDHWKAFHEAAIQARLARVKQAIAADQRRPMRDGMDLRGRYDMCRRALLAGDGLRINVALGKHALTVFWGCSFNHATRALNDLGVQAQRFTYARLAPQLNTYGHCLLLAQRTDCVMPAKLAGVYHGKIDHRYAITLIVGARPIDVTAYAYDRIGTLIDLSRRKHISAPAIVFDHGPKTAESFFLRRHDGKLSGQWQQDHQAPLPVTLTPAIDATPPPR